MSYQELYAKYQAALKLRELDSDNNFKALKDIFIKKILSSISFSAPNQIIIYLSGIKDVFEYVENEVTKVDLYREQLDKAFSEQDRS